MSRLWQKTTLTIVAITAAMMLWHVVPQVLAGQTDEAPQVWRRGSAVLDAALMDETTETKSRLREGILFNDRSGTFSAVGDCVLFHADGVDEPLGVLENLALERIWSMLGDTEGRSWSVSGMVTEYRGRNYLFVHRAVLRAKAARAGGHAAAQP